MPPLPLLLLPGLDGTGRLFRQFAAELPGSIDPRTIAYPSDRLFDDGSLMAHVTDQLPRRGRYALLAESFSGPLALTLASARPERLAAVVLVATFHRRPVPAWMAALASAARPLLGRPPPAWAVRRFLAGPDAPPALVQDVREAVASVSPRVIRARMRAALTADASAALAGCAVPVLYLAGTRDRLLRRGLPAELAQLHQRLEVRAIDAPHLVLQAEPRRSARVVAEFLARSGALP